MDDGNEDRFKQLIKAHGVRVGQQYIRKNGMSRQSMEVVWVTVAFAVMHSTHESIPCEAFKAAGIYGIKGRYAQPFVENIQYIKDNYHLVKDVPEVEEPIFRFNLLGESNV